MKQNIKEYLLDYILMEAALLILWISIIDVIIHKEFVIWIDLNVFTGFTILGTVVWIIGLIREVKK